MKICNKCGVEKEEAEFRKGRSACKMCASVEHQKRCEGPAYREARNAANRERRKDPAYRVAEAEAQRERRKDPGVRAAYKEAQRIRLEDPEVRAAYKEAQRIRLEDPEVRAAFNEAVRKANCKRRNFLNLLKMERPCYDCGGTFLPEAMDWDHLPGKVKSFNLSTCCGHPLEKVIDEINKCQLVCANCHRVRTSARRQKKEEI